MENGGGREEKEHREEYLLTRLCIITIRQDGAII
jgi:hypothetical protein